VVVMRHTWRTEIAPSTELARMDEPQIRLA
jgi:hypothetical protein